MNGGGSWHNGEINSEKRQRDLQSCWVARRSVLQRLNACSMWIKLTRASAADGLRRMGPSLSQSFIFHSLSVALGDFLADLLASDQAE